MFTAISKMKKSHQTVFAVVIAFAVISFWRGIWGLMDIYMFPDNLEYSYLSSMIIGLCILVATHMAAKELA